MLNFHGCGSVPLRRDHESCCGGKSLMRFMMSQFAIEFAACRVTQSKLSHPSLRLVPPQQTRNGSAVTKGHEKVWVEFRRFGKFGRLSMLRVCIFKLPKPSKPLNLLNKLNNFRGRASGAREYRPTDYFIFPRKIFAVVRHIV